VAAALALASPAAAQVKHIILFIGDGMQMAAEVGTSRYLFGKDDGLSFHQLPYKGWLPPGTLRVQLPRQSRRETRLRSENDSSVDRLRRRPGRTAAVPPANHRRRCLPDWSSDRLGVVRHRTGPRVTRPTTATSPGCRAIRPTAACQRSPRSCGTKRASRSAW
jgi:hypothetical protein